MDGTKHVRKRVRDVAKMARDRKAIQPGTGGAGYVCLKSIQLSLGHEADQEPEVVKQIHASKASSRPRIPDADPWPRDGP